MKTFENCVVISNKSAATVMAGAAVPAIGINRGGGLCPM